MHQKLFILTLFLSLVGCGGGGSSTSQPTTDSSQPTTDSSQSATDAGQPVTTSGQQPKSFNLMSVEASANKVKTFKFEWQNSKGASSYTLCQKDASKENDCLVLKDGIVSTSYEYTLDDLLNSQNSYFVIAKNSSGKILSNERNIDEQVLTAAVGFLKASGNKDDKNDGFGFTVQLSSDSQTLAIGAPGLHNELGAVYVFTRQGGVWSQQQELKASDFSSKENDDVDENDDVNVELFGLSISLSADGNMLAIGAHNDVADKHGRQDAGVVYIFTRHDSVWSKQQKLKTPVFRDAWGNSITLSADGNVLAIGDMNDDGDNSNQQEDSGAVYIFTQQDSKWTQKQKIKASDISIKGYFGSSVSLSSDGNTLAVAAWAPPLGKSGSVYIFTQQNSTWNQQQKLQSLNIDANDGFGFSAKLSSDGNTLAAGAPGDENKSGAVYLFTRQNSAWTLQQKIKPSDNKPDDGFGTAVSLNADGSILAAGAINLMALDREQQVKSGAVYIFTNENSLWHQQQKFKALDIDEKANFGVSVTLSANGKALAAGAPIFGTGPGAVCLY